MIQMTVGDYKAQFSSVLEKVLQGEEVQIQKKKKRPLGLYEGKASYWEDETFEFTPENLFDNMDNLL